MAKEFSDQNLRQLSEEELGVLRSISVGKRVQTLCGWYGNGVVNRLIPLIRMGILRNRDATPDDDRIHSSDVIEWSSDEIHQQLKRLRLL